MRYISKYDIAFKGLKEGIHQFVFDIDDKFFEQFENSLVESGNITADVELTKQSTLMILNMTVSGNVELQCDCCLDYYLQPVSNNNKMYVKFGHKEEDESDDIIVVPFEENKLNIVQYLYELIILGLPIQHFHPNDKNGNSTCNPEMLEKLNEYLVDENIEDNEDDNDEPVDERWNELKKLLDNK